ncbi:peptide-methionine (R)-S-oxide reductase MsrB [Gillisia sp. M10.2A]|uniref:peptide-methionine (R)-S-oxide reductase n=1 Tax=Gillisia lutea TaxID=2909668 RepID=A0ABS9ELP2_9FLAO|nr:peptide-methionine (R)-S-oxide reductase MsrB [Gillisia lutea]MCF4102809.1 peptide-methionine (R)-S-oxide reductase MsrB [Gillisia lutea]
MKKFFLVLLVVIAVSCNGNAQKNQTKSSAKYNVSKTDTEWKASLTAEQYAVMINEATEPPFSSELNDIKTPGTFVCAACGNEVYETKYKFDSGTGWPSFDRAIKGGVAYGSDSKLGYSRDEVHCANCGGHLGHVFDDGPKETTGKRHCINGVAMKFVPKTK